MPHGHVGTEQGSAQVDSLAQNPPRGRAAFRLSARRLQRGSLFSAPMGAGQGAPGAGARGYPGGGGSHALEAAGGEHVHMTKQGFCSIRHPGLAKGPTLLLWLLWSEPMKPQNPKCFDHKMGAKSFRPRSRTRCIEGAARRLGALARGRPETAEQAFPGHLAPWPGL